MRHRILVLDPGHFHAALLFSRSSPRVDPVIHVHAPPGPDVEAFIALIDGFNNRNIDPTSWRLESHIGVKALDTLIAERHGEIVVLADKPWLTDSANLPHLDAITAQGPLGVDIMTGRHSALAACAT